MSKNADQLKFIRGVTFIIVRDIVKDLSSSELSVLYHISHIYLDPRPLACFPTVADLFNATDSGLRMHPETLAALESIIEERTSKP